MVEYTAIVIAIGLVMFYLLDLSRNFQSTEEGIAGKFLGWIRLFYVFVSLVFGLLLLYITYSISVLQTTGSPIDSGLLMGVRAWGVVILITAMLVPVYYLLILPAHIKEVINFKKGEQKK